MMQNIRENTERDIKSLQESMQKLERVVEEQRQVIDYNMENTATEMRAMKADTSQQLQSMADIFKESLVSAIGNHDLAMNLQFSEIKAMIAAGPAIASPPPKKHKPGGNANYSQEDL